MNFSNGDKSSKISSIKEASMSNSSLRRKSERVTLPQSIWLKRLKMDETSQSKHSQKKQLTVKTKEKNASSRKLKSCEF